MTTSDEPAGTTPRALTDLPQIEVDKQVIVGHEAADRVVLLDPVFAILFNSLDGKTSLDELRDDLTVIDGVSAEHAQWIVGSFVDSLGGDGFIHGVEHNRLPRHAYVPVTADSCAGRRIGLSRAELIHIVGQGDGLRIGSTVPGVVDRIASHFDTEPADETSAYETIVLRATGSSRSKRAQRVVDHLAQTLYEGADYDEAIDAFERTVSGRVDLVQGGAWLEGPVLSRGDVAVLVHPGLTSRVFRDHRTALGDAGFSCLRSGLNQLLPGGTLRLPANRFGGGDEQQLRVKGALVGRADDRAATTKDLLHLCRRWDHPHFEAFGKLASELPLVAVQPDAAPAEWARWAEEAASGSGRSAVA